MTYAECMNFLIDNIFVTFGRNVTCDFPDGNRLRTPSSQFFSYSYEADYVKSRKKLPLHIRWMMYFYLTLLNLVTMLMALDLKRLTFVFIGLVLFKHWYSVYCFVC